MQHRILIKAFALSASVISKGAFGTLAADTIKTGILRSLSGRMAISETPLKGMELMISMLMTVY